jgi:hypothetical protein
MNSVIVTPGPQCSCAQAAAVSANAATAAHRARSLLALLAEPGAGSHLNLPFGNGQKIAPPGARCQSAARTKPIGLAACRCRTVFSRSTLSPAGGADGGRRAASDGPARQARSAGRSAAPDIAAECFTQIRDRIHASVDRLWDALPRYGGREAHGRSCLDLHFTDMARCLT